MSVYPDLYETKTATETENTQYTVIKQPATEGFWNHHSTKSLLDFLVDLDKLSVRQNCRGCSACMSCEPVDHFLVRNAKGEEILTAMEDKDCCDRMIQPFHMGFTDANGRDVMKIARTSNFDGCYFWDPRTVHVSSPPDVKIGSVVQRNFWIQPKFDVLNEADDVVLKIEGPSCGPGICCADVRFPIFSADGSVKVGEMFRKWRGCKAESLSTTDSLGINFPSDLNIKTKATLLGALLFINKLYFEDHGGSTSSATH